MTTKMKDRVVLKGDLKIEYETVVAWGIHEGYNHQQLSALIYKFIIQNYDKVGGSIGDTSFVWEAAEELATEAMQDDSAEP